MQPTGLRELDPMDASRPRAGEIPGWAAMIAWAGAIVTIAICFAAPRLLANQGDDPVLETDWFHNTLAVGVMALLGLVCAPLVRTQRSLRVAAALPLVHLAGLGIAWVGWSVLSPKIAGARGLTPLVEAIPLSHVLLIVLGATALGAFAVARRRRGEVVHAMVMISLVGLLLLGAWLPIVARSQSGGGYLDSWTVDLELVGTPRLIAMVLVPPFVAAVAYTALALRRARIAQRKLVWLAIYAMMWCAAVAVRADAAEMEMVMYANYLPWLFAGAVTIVVAIAALAGATWLATRFRRTAQHRGIVDAPMGETIAGFAITSWLRGPEPIASGFELTTKDGSLPVPASARVRAPLPLESTIARVGEIVPVVRGGDEVAVSGYEQHESGQPFRDSSAPIPSTAGVEIAPTRAGAAGLEQLVLAAWRPAIAYLFVLLAVAVPALISLGHAH